MKIDKNSDILKEKDLYEKAQDSVKSSVQLLRDKKLSVGFAESCTGGLLSSLFTEQAGVSDVFVGAIISYDNAVKEKFLKVPEKLLKTEGAVSKAVAKQMAEEVQKSLAVKVSVSITGIAGPSGGTKEKPVGIVFMAVAGLESETKVFEHHFDGNRKQIQLQTCIEAIKHLNEFINK